tara:strand:- start:898 stop:1425 length:528 start_codon:yes stop_codon:yes gene_type:complete
MAKDFNLQVSEKPDSQDICFVTSNSYRDLINKIQPETNKEGDIFDMNGNKIGRHKGISNYTIGQRKGLGISGQDEPLYVSEVNKKQNYIVLATYDKLKQNKFYFNNINWLGNSITKNDLQCSAKIRSTQIETAGKLNITGDKGNFIFDEEILATSPGQACVFYRDDQVLGGGWII